MYSTVTRVVNIHDIPEQEIRKVAEVLQNDLREYESLDQDFGKGTEKAIQNLLKAIEPVITQNQDGSDEETDSENT